MAVANTKSLRVSRAEATPILQDNQAVAAASPRSIIGFVAVASGDDDGSVYRLARVHSSWVLHGIEIQNTAITGGTDYDLGLYQTAANGGAEVDKDVYMDGQTLASAVLTGADRLSHTRALTKTGQRVWEDAGLSADPGRYYDLCLTGNTVGTADGTVGFRVIYAEG
jgi:hypothetical protein